MLKIKNLKKTFNTRQTDEREIFKNLSFEVKPREFVTVIGGNGVGKSSLMNLIAGSDFPDSGKIYINGKDVTNLPEHKRAKFIGRVFQDPLKGTAPNLTLEENLSLAALRCSRRGLKFAVSKKNTDFFRAKLETLGLGLENRMKAKIGQFSGGQRQAVTLLMATLAHPKLLLLDEHTAALDAKSREKICELTKKITKDEEMTTLMITHNIEDAFNFGIRTLALSPGGVVTDLGGAEERSLNLKNCNWMRYL